MVEELVIKLNSNLLQTKILVNIHMSKQVNFITQKVNRDLIWTEKEVFIIWHRDTDMPPDDVRNSCKCLIMMIPKFWSCGDNVPSAGHCLSGSHSTTHLSHWHWPHHSTKLHYYHTTVACYWWAQGRPALGKVSWQGHPSTHVPVTLARKHCNVKVANRADAEQDWAGLLATTWPPFTYTTSETHWLRFSNRILNL